VVARVALLALVACASAPRPVVAIVSANAEWHAMAPQLAGAAVEHTPYGDWTTRRLAGRDVIFFHGGYGKVAAAGSTQYAIDRWHPALLVNLGTCGGFGGERKVGDIVLASETTIYDVIERMGSADEAIADFHSQLDPSLWPARLASRVVVAPLISADQDLDPAAVAALRTRFHASVGDWESGAIAWVATHNHVPVVILRGVTDVIDHAGGDPTYNAIEVWQQASIAVMATLISLLGEAMPELLR